MVFSNLARKVVFFNLGSKFFLPNGLHLPTKQPWGSRSFDFDITYFISNYSYSLAQGSDKLSKILFSESRVSI